MESIKKPHKNQQVKNMQKQRSKDCILSNSEIKQAFARCTTAI
jgi:hypothetical protein